MRAVVQRVTQASVTVDGELLGRIGKGLLILLGVADGDTRELTEKMADKICRLRIFEDENGKTNLCSFDRKLDRTTFTDKLLERGYCLIF